MSSSVTGLSSSFTHTTEPNKESASRSLTRFSTFDSSAIFDLYVRCKRCDDFILLFKWNEHKRLHKLLDACGWKRSVLPNDDDLAKLRQQILQKYRMDDDAKTIHLMIDKLNEGFDFLRSMKDDQDRMARLMACMPSIRDYVSEELSSCVPCISACGISSSDPKAYITYAPEAHSTPIYHDGFGGLDSQCFLAVCDSINGTAASESILQWLQRSYLEIGKSVFGYRCSCALNAFDHRSNYTTECHNAGPAQPGKNKMLQSIRLPHVGVSRNVLKQIYAKCGDQLDETVVDRVGSKVAREIGAERRVHKHLFEYLDHVLSYGVKETSQVRWSACSLAMVTVVAKSAFSWRDLDVDSDRDASQDAVQFGPGAEPVHLADLLVANAGNTAVLLLRGNRIMELSKDDSCASRKQRRREALQLSVLPSIADRSGKQEKETETDAASQEELNSAVPLKRALGVHGDVQLKAKVHHAAHYTRVRLDQFCQFLILTSGGLLRCLSNEKLRQLIVNTSRDICTELWRSRLENTAESEVATMRSAPVSRAQSARSDLSFATTSVTLFEPSSPRELTPEPTNESLAWAAGALPRQPQPQPSQPTTASKSVDGVRQFLPECDESERFRRTLARRLAEALYRAARLTACRDAVSVAVLLLPGCEQLIRETRVKTAQMLAAEAASARDSRLESELLDDQASRATTSATTASTTSRTTTVASSAS